MALVTPIQLHIPKMTATLVGGTDTRGANIRTTAYIPKIKFELKSILSGAGVSSREEIGLPTTTSHVDNQVKSTCDQLAGGG